MIYKDVDIYACKFFTLNQDKKLQFYSGVNRGKTIDDYRTLPELQKVVAYCFWILKKEDIPPISKWLAAEFLKSLGPKFAELEKFTKKIALSKQKKLAKETEELVKTPGKKYV